ncbi:MAG: MMPL family transporter [Oscillospiraceae bacterium]|jgi:predicted RND superfamily exporter protein|nr:MMPL family transporter [Oscillospiraceae bacterium]
MRFSKAVVKCRVPILIITLLLMIPAALGMAGTRINYDMLDYLPADMETVVGQNELLEEFGKGAFSLLILEDMPARDVSALKDKIEQVDHVESVLWYDSLLDITVPMELLPERLYDAFNAGNATMMAVFFDTSTSSDLTMDAIREIRSIAGSQCFVSGMSALVTDLKDLCEKEEPIYVGIAVALACGAMLLLLDSWLAPFVFLASIGMMILLNLGTNYFMGEISYITKALSAVLQLAVTMDYSIFLWNSYNEQRALHGEKGEAMAAAVQATLASVTGSSITTIAGFIALCFMTFTMGRDLGIVMAKGVLLGVIGCVTVLPSLILVFDKPLQKTRHRALIPNARHLASGVVKGFPLFLVIFALVIPPALYGYNRTNSEVYYDMGQCLPEDMAYVIANEKLSEDFGVASTHMLLVDSGVPAKEVRAMIRKMEAVDGVRCVLGLESVTGFRIPEGFLPESVTDRLDSGKWELLLVNSEYKVASDEAGRQLDQLGAILKDCDPAGMLIGEAPCMKDMIETTDRDFQVVNTVSIIAIFLIIALVEKSFTLPFLLIAVIEAAIFVNLGLPHYLGQSLPFIAPICISTIQLGATVDYAILMTTRYKVERLGGADKKKAVHTALATSVPSIIVSGMGLFAATFGVALYSDIDIISSMCMLMARGALISMASVILILPALLLLCDRLVCATTAGMRHLNRKNNKNNDFISNQEVYVK